LFLAPATHVSGADLDLAKQSVIRRDTYGVPHILAETEQAAAFAHGYATSEDHFLELARHFLRPEASKRHTSASVCPAGLSD